MPQYNLCTGCKLLDLFGFYYFFARPHLVLWSLAMSLTGLVSEAERSRILLYFLKTVVEVKGCQEHGRKKKRNCNISM